MPSIRNLRDQMDAALAGYSPIASHSLMSDSQSALTDKEKMLRDLTEYRPEEINELLVDLDNVMQGFTEAQRCQRHSICQTFSDKNVFLGDEGIVEGEMGLPSYVYIAENGTIRYRFHTRHVDEYGEALDLGYSSFDAPMDVSSPFPVVYDHLQALILRDHGHDLFALQRAIAKRFHGKPQMIDLANEAINHGRRMRACNLLEEEGEAKEGFYEKTETYGMF